MTRNLRSRSLLTTRSLLAALALAGAPAAEAQEVRGIADLHNHQMNQLGFGGRLIHGEAFGEIDQALPYCDGKHGSFGTVSPWLDPPHLVGGYPEFNGWPHWNLKTHQQVYEDWLKRAHDGGLNLIVMLAGHNEHLCKLNLFLGEIFTPTNLLVAHEGCGGMNSVYKEIELAKEMDAARDWYQIVYTPQEARNVIQEGKLAVVLGVEIPYLFGCGTGAAPTWIQESVVGAVNTATTELEAALASVIQIDLSAVRSAVSAAMAELAGELDNQCSEDDVVEGLKQLHTAGVRHLFPIHNANNGFGAAALYNEVFTYPSPELNVPGLRDCSAEGYEFNNSQCNEGGLTELGEFFDRQLMERGMMIDIDHQSHLAKLDLLALAETYDYPLVSSHTGILDISSGERRHEGNMSGEFVQRVRDLGGVIAPIVIQGEPETTSSYQGRIPHSCGNSAESFAQAYLYLKDKMPGVGIPIGSDFNGLAGLPGPRFMDGPTVRLQASGGQYVGAPGGGGTTVSAAGEPSAWDVNFELVDHNGGALNSGDVVSLRTASGMHYITADSVALGVLVATRTVIDAWEKFTIEKSGGGAISSGDTVSFKGDNGMYVAAEGGGGGALFANRGAADEWERFVITIAAAAGNNDQTFDGCYALTDGGKKQVEYPFTSSITGKSFDRQVIGNRTMDINVDGLTNVGMLPDFIAELKAVGLSDQDLEPLYSSAEAYIRSWEKAGEASGRLHNEALRLDLGGQPALDSADWSTLEGYCTEQHQRLATSAEVCPDGPGSAPIYGTPEGDVWMAVGDHENAWISIGTSYPERRCRLHEELGSAPGWGTDKGPEPVTGQPAALKCVSGPLRVSTADTGGSFNWSQAEAWCVERGLRLATSAQVCPYGAGRTPGFSQPEGDVWMAVGDHENAWISIGTSYPERRCRLHEELGSAPGWGTDKGPEPATGQPAALLCRTP